ncbi:hypothetical protein HPB49_001092 [Dermacentor silvarum]|uniref:Uncharacterized protein n=1 Tax=Dermacentor silvarum TaxID=543639 RepID=A0ACB8DST6_DERSI|nr:hypothetical protein HPB49_001092 [Dermacentor silvarum]
MMGSTNQALVTFSGIQVPRHVRLYGAELRCYIYRPRQQICSVCLSMGNRADVCPTPDKPRCVACGTSNPLPEHECTHKCIHCGGDHPATDPRCPSRQQRSISRMCSRNVSNAKSCVPHLDQHIYSQPRTTAGSCGIRTNRQRHQRTPPCNPQLVDAAVLMAHLDMIDRQTGAVQATPPRSALLAVAIRRNMASKKVATTKNKR